MGRVHREWRTNIRLLRRSCYRSDGEAKVRWPNRTSALFVADLTNWRAAEGRADPRGRIPVGTVQAYLCRLCDGWHVGRPMIPEWHHTCLERREDLIAELGIRAVALVWRENSSRIRAEVGDTPDSRRGRVSRQRVRRAA